MEFAVKGAPNLFKGWMGFFRLNGFLKAYRERRFWLLLFYSNGSIMIHSFVYDINPADACSRLWFHVQLSGRIETTAAFSRMMFRTNI